MDNRIKVAIRCRPHSDQITLKNEEIKKENILTYSNQNDTCTSYSNIHVALPKHGIERNFSFDHVFPPETSQEVIFEEIGKPILDELLFNDINGTILAYGQTGTGKTFTMGILDIALEREDAGLIPRCFEYIFNTLEESDKGNIIIKVSFFQIYLEMVQDLLIPSSRLQWKQDLPIRYTNEKGFYVEGLSEYEVKNFIESQSLVGLAMKNRILATTKRNFTSSRSHTILNITLEKKISTNIIRSKLSLVDLAGSERSHPNCNDKKRKKEANSINASLSSLGNVINGLTNSKTKHIRYRDSTLTKLLKNIFTDINSKISLLGTVDGYIKHQQETISTLKFISQCKKINQIEYSTGFTKDEMILHDKESKSNKETNDKIHEYYQNQIALLESKIIQMTDENDKKIKKSNNIIYNENVHDLISFQENDSISPSISRTIIKHHLDKIESDNGSLLSLTMDSDFNESQDIQRNHLMNKKKLNIENEKEVEKESHFNHAMKANSMKLLYNAITTINSKLNTNKDLSMINIPPAIEDFENEKLFIAFISQLYSNIMEILENRELRKRIESLEIIKKDNKD